MSDLRVTSPDQGLNLRVHPSQIGNWEAAGALNMLYSRGLFKTPFGFAAWAYGVLGSPIMGLAEYRGHRIAATRTGLYEFDQNQNIWVSRGPATPLITAPHGPVSFVRVPHTDGIAINGTGDSAYEHFLYCDGGASPIQRWEGSYESTFYPLAGADGYHETDVSPATPTVHYAKQVNLFYNHVILLNPKTWNATSNVFEDNLHTVLWGKAGLLEGSDAYKIADTGAGYIDLVDTGDENVWSLQLGSMLIVYQNHSIWSLSHVGGSDVFRTRVELADLGLLSPHLLAPHGNMHYFVGNDYNIYRYYGGATKELIGEGIRDALVEELDNSHLNQCFMAIGSHHSRLWLMFVPSGQSYVTKAYGVDLKTGQWMVRDYSHAFASGEGLTCAALIGASSYFQGQTYAEAVATTRTYAAAVSLGTTYAQRLTEVSIDERLCLGDSTGVAYQYDSDLTTDKGVAVPAYHITKAFDWNTPDEPKAWQGFVIEARGDKLAVSYRVDEFQTEDEGWYDFAVVTLADVFRAYTFALDGVSSEAIQFRIANYAGGVLQCKGFTVLEPFSIGGI